MTGRGERLLTWAAGAISLLFTLTSFVPWNPPRTHGHLEDSFILMLHAAFHERWQFGTDIVFTLGPWGFLYGGYYPDTHLVATLTWAILAVVFWWIARDTARHLLDNELVSWLWLMALIATTDPIVTLNTDVRVTIYILLLLVRHFFVVEQRMTAMEATLVASLGLLSLVKFSFMVYAAVVVFVVALDLVVRQRRFPWPVAVYGASLLVFWYAAGQHGSSIGPYVANALLVTGGFTESMSLTGPTELRDVCLFAAAAALVLLSAGSAAWMRHRRAGVLFVVPWAFGLFVAFKYGYTRHDAHDVTAVLELLAMSLMCVAVLWPHARKRGWAFMLSILLLPLAIGAFSASTYARRPELGWNRSPMLSWKDLAAVPWGDGGRKTLRDAYQEFLAEVRDGTPLPRLEGTTDAYAFNQVAILAHGLPLRSRPVIQSYCAFTPELAELNAAFLRGRAAPENILFQLETVDHRYPSLDDGLSWPELITRYDLREVANLFVVLKRSPSPREFHLRPLRQIQLAFGEQLDVPSTADGPVWAEIEIAPTVAGSVVSSLYKPPQLWLNATLRDGRELTKRIVPGITKGGFVLSPLVEDSGSFAALVAGRGPGELTGNELTAFSITVADGSSPTTHYRNPMSVRLYRLEFPGQDVSNITGYQQVAHLRRFARIGMIASADRAPQFVYVPGVGTLIDFPRQSVVVFRPPPGALRLKLKVGIRGADGASPPVATEILFRLSSVDEQGEPVPFWTQRVDPGARFDIQEPVACTVDLQGIRSSTLVLEALPERGSIDKATAFVSDIEFEPN